MNKSFEQLQDEKQQEREYIAKKIIDYLASPFKQIKHYPMGYSTLQTSPYFLEEGY